MSNDQAKNQALEQPGAKRYVCGSCGANASTKLYVCSHCKVTRYCSADHQKKDKKFHLGKVCYDLRKSRKQYRKRSKGKNKPTANDDTNDPSSTDLQLWNEQQQQNHDNSDDTANIDPPTSRSRKMHWCNWLTDLVFGLFVLGAYSLCCRRCCFCCCRFQSEEHQLRKCNKQTYRWMHRSPMQLLILMFIVIGCVVGQLLVSFGSDRGRVVGSKRGVRNEKKLFAKLFLACADGDLNTATELLQIDGIDINRRYSGFTPLSIACQQGHSEVVQVLVTMKEIQINQAGKNRATPLYMACQEGHLKVVQVLLTRKEILICKRW